MIRRPVLLAAALAGCLPFSAGAQESGPIDPDLRCVALAAMLVGTAEKPEEKSGLGMSLTYFVGLYEARSGKLIGDGLTLAAIEQVSADMAGAIAECQPRMLDLGNRLTSLGAQLRQVDDAMKDPAQ